MWFLFALGSAFFAALVAVFAKLGLSRVDATTATAFRSVVMAVVLVTVVFSLGKLNGPSMQQLSKPEWSWILFSGLAGAASWLCYFFALKAGPTAGVVALDRLSVVLVLLLAAVVLHEAITWRSGLGALLVVAGSILISLKA
jgi:transporter family protein